MAAEDLDLVYTNSSIIITNYELVVTMSSRKWGLDSYCRRPLLSPHPPPHLSLRTWVELCFELFSGIFSTKIRISLVSLINVALDAFCL